MELTLQLKLLRRCQMQFKIRKRLSANSNTQYQRISLLNNKVKLQVNKPLLLERYLGGVTQDVSFFLDK